MSATKHESKINLGTDKHQGTSAMDFINQFRRDTMDCLKKQHLQILRQAPYIYNFTCNQDKNRFSNVALLDKSRVCIGKVFKEDTDYVNASFVDGKEHGHFILSQYPLQHTVVEFWRMVLEQKVQFIICLTQYEHDVGFQYWPFPGRMSGGKFKPQEMDFSHGTQHRFHIVNKGVTQPRAHCYVNELEIDYWMMPNTKKQQKHVQILHFVDWPKAKIPSIESVVDLTELLLSKVDEQVFEADGKHRPIILHCASGAGRSATLATISLCCRQLLMSGKFNVLQNANFVRQNRWGSNNSSQYYAFIYLCVLRMATRRGFLDENDPDFQAFTKCICQHLTFERQSPLRQLI